MDFNYRENIAGSPFVDEGWADRLGASAAATIRRGRALAGHEFQGLPHEKIKYLFDKFENRVRNIMMDFADPDNYSNVYNRLSQMTHPSLNATQLYLLKTLYSIYQIVVNRPKLSRAIGTRNVSRPTDPTQPSNASILSELVSKILEKNLSTLKAIQSNDANKILEAYISQLKLAYDSFYSDAKRTTGMTDTQIEGIITNLYPQTGDPTLSNEPRKIDILKTIRYLSTYIDRLVPKKQQTTGSVTGNKPSSKGTSVPSSTSPSTPPPLPASATGDTEQGGQELPPDDYAAILIKTAEIVIAAVKADTSRSEDIMDPNAPLATSWGQPIVPEKPKVTKEAEEADELSPESETGVEDDFEQSDDEFVYNFRGKLRKSRHFSIEVPTFGNDIVTDPVSNTPKYKIRVFWENEQSHNVIRAVYSPISSTGVSNRKEKMLVAFDFYDSLIYTKLTSSKEYSLEKLTMDTGNVSKTKLTKVTNPTIKTELQKINQPSGQFHRALLVIVHRKGMEFKPKPRSLKTLTVDDFGNVTLHHSRGKKDIFYKDKESAKKARPDLIKDPKTDQLLDPKIVNDKNIPQPIHYIKEVIYLTNNPNERAAWRKSLEHIDYFNDFPDMAPSPAENVRIEAIAELIQQKISPQFAAILVDKAIQVLPIVNPKLTAASLTKEDIYEWINANPYGYPSYLSDIISFVKTAFNYDQTNAENHVRAIWDKLKDEKWIESPETIKNFIVQRLQQQKDTESEVNAHGTVKQDGENIIWVHPKTGVETSLDKTEIIKALANQKNKHFIDAMTKAGLIDKYKQDVETYIAALKSKTKVSELINPYQLANLL